MYQHHLQYYWRRPHRQRRRSRRLMGRPRHLSTIPHAAPYSSVVDRTPLQFPRRMKSSTSIGNTARSTAVRSGKYVRWSRATECFLVPMASIAIGTMSPAVRVILSYRSSRKFPHPFLGATITIRNWLSSHCMIISLTGARIT